MSVIGSVSNLSFYQMEASLRDFPPSHNDDMLSVFWFYENPHSGLPSEEYRRSLLENLNEDLEERKKDALPPLSNGQVLEMMEKKLDSIILYDDDKVMTDRKTIGRVMAAVFAKRIGPVNTNLASLVKKCRGTA